jgi:hypothetical protein
MFGSRRRQVVGAPPPRTCLAMSTATGGTSIAAEFRDALIIDRYDPSLERVRASRRRRLQGGAAEEAVAWNVFRSLRQVDPSVWLPDLFSSAFPSASAPPSRHATVCLWQPVAPPPSLAAEGDEGADGDVDVVIETPAWVWFIEAEAGGGGAAASAPRRERNQVLRGIDAGSYYAGVRSFFYSLLVAARDRARPGDAAVVEYANLARPRELLRDHRPDGLANLRGVSLLTWAQLAEVLADAREGARRDDEREYAARAAEWLRGRGVA